MLARETAMATSDHHVRVRGHRVDLVLLASPVDLFRHAVGEPKYRRPVSSFMTHAACC